MAGWSAYVLRDAAGVVLYVGVSKNPAARMGSLSRAHRWMSDVAAMEVVALPDGEDELVVEGRMIEELDPLHNVRRSGGSGRVATTGTGLAGMQRYLLKAPEREMVEWRLAAEGWPSFAEWLRCAAREKAMREPGVVGRPGRVVSSVAVEPSLSRGARCTADAPRGMRCRICGNVHRV